MDLGLIVSRIPFIWQGGVVGVGSSVDKGSMQVGKAGDWNKGWLENNVYNVYNVMYFIKVKFY